MMILMKQMKMFPGTRKLPALRRLAGAHPLGRTMMMDGTEKEHDPIAGEGNQGPGFHRRSFPKVDCDDKPLKLQGKIESKPKKPKKSILLFPHVL